MKAMIFAAGLGTRLKPLTETLPKALVPLAGKALLQWQIELLNAAGITDIVLCEKNRKDVEDIPEKYLKGLKFHYVQDIQEVIDFALV